MRYIYAFIAVFAFAGCSISEPRSLLRDLKTMPQDASYYTAKETISPFSSSNIKRDYFAIWHEVPKVDMAYARWAFDLFDANNSYGENYLPKSEEFFSHMLDEASLDELMSYASKGVMIQNSSLRAMPTSRMIFLDPTKAGEGFPFDYLQTSAIYANEPVVISHYSKSKKWIYVVASFASGWVRSSEVAFVDDDLASRIESCDLVVSTRDKEAIYNENGLFLFGSRVGMIFYKPQIYAKSHKALAFARDLDAKSVEMLVDLDPSVFKPLPLELNMANIEQIYAELYKNIYGWGGMYDERDCSSMVRDLFMTFGKWLPRNSKEQAQMGKQISLLGLSGEAKLELIKKEGVAFRTLIYKKGHIMLYVGTLDDEVVVFHNTWGVRTKDALGKEGRYVVGGAIYSTLRLGKELKNFDKKSELLEGIESLSIIE